MTSELSELTVCIDSPLFLSINAVSTYKSTSSLALEAKTAYLQSREMLKKIPVNRKKLVFEQEDSLLDENNLKG